MTESTDADRLEQLWSGNFGDEWADRNLDYRYELRQPFWDGLMKRLSPARVLDIGCNAGGNLRWIAPHLEPGGAYGIDVNRHSLNLIHDYVPDANVLVASATAIPFRDDFFDLVFTVGVLVVVPEETIALAVQEMARTSSRYVLAMEMYAPELTLIPHREIERGLFKRDYGSVFVDAAPELSLVDTGFLSPEEGFDSLTWWLFEKG
jgi:pseudaminic acid biosynthesis-associated methylase